MNQSIVLIKEGHRINDFKEIKWRGDIGNASLKARLKLLMMELMDLLKIPKSLK